MKIKIDIELKNLRHLDQACGIRGRSWYINQLLASESQKSEDNDEQEEITRLHRRQKGYTFPTMIQPRGQSGSIRRGSSGYNIRSE